MVQRNFYVQTGRVAVINFGPLSGRHVTILDVVDANRVLVEGPTSGVRRQTMSIRNLGLTNIRFRVPRTAKTGTLRKYIVANKIDEKASKNTWVVKAKKQATRAALTDFERFQVRVLKSQRRAILNTKA